MTMMKKISAMVMATTMAATMAVGTVNYIYVTEKSTIMFSINISYIVKVQPPYTLKKTRACSHKYTCGF